MKIYIAGPMTGYKDLNYPAFNRMQAELIELGHEPLNPATVDNGGVARSWEWYMRRTLTMMLQADAVLLMDGWEGSRGARIESDLAWELSIPVYEGIAEIPL